MGWETFKAPGKTKKEHAFCFRKHCMQIAPRHFRLPPENRGPGPQLKARKTGCGVSILRWQVPRKDFCSYGSTQTKLWLRNHELEFYTLFLLPNLHLFDNTFLLMEDQLSHKSYHFICTGETAFDSWHLRMDADLIFFLGFFGQGRGSEFLFSSMEGVYKRAFYSHSQRVLELPPSASWLAFFFFANLNKQDAIYSPFAILLFTAIYLKPSFKLSFFEWQLSFREKKKSLSYFFVVV